jgi:protein translocase SecG subunit
MELILSILQVFVSIVLIFLILMHSGKDAGLSGAFGVGTGAGPFGGGPRAKAQATVAPVTRRPRTRIAGHTTPVAKRRP